MKYILPCVASFMITVAVTPLIIRLAHMYNCLDTPGGRRLHCRTTPRWGGVAFFAGVLPILFMENAGGALTSYIVASSLLVGMGMIDDLRSLDWKPKLAVMATATSIVIFGGNFMVQHVGTYGSLGHAELGWLRIPFTFVSIIGITNAINLLDGLNGLAGGVSLLSFLFMGIAALLAGNIPVAIICFAFVGALGAFLLYNFPNARIFMGDTGSLFLGFSLACTAVLLTQDTTAPVEALFPALVLIIPIFDTLRVLVVRLLNGRNPFKADTIHLHYLMVHKNISPAQVTLMFWSATAVLGVIALALTSRTSMPYLAAVLSASLTLSLCASGLMQSIQHQEKIDGETPDPTGMEEDMSGFTRYFANTRGNSQKGGIIMTFKWLVVFGIVLLSVQMVAGETPAVTTGQDMQSGQPTPNKAKLSKHNQAAIKQTEAAKIRNDTARSKLSKTNKAKLRQADAAKKKRDLIEKTNADSTTQQQ